MADAIIRGFLILGALWLAVLVLAGFAAWRTRHDPADDAQQRREAE